MLIGATQRMFKVHYVASEGERKASEENGARVFKSGFKLGALN